MRNKHTTDSLLRRYKLTKTIACVLLHTLGIPMFPVQRNRPVVTGPVGPVFTGPLFHGKIMNID